MEDIALRPHFHGVIGVVKVKCKVAVHGAFSYCSLQSWKALALVTLSSRPIAEKDNPFNLNSLALSMTSVFVRGLPNAVPLARTLASPAFVRSEIRMRSCLARQAISDMIASANIPQ